MNLENFPAKLERYLNDQNADEWRGSYERFVVLHEFGHALGLGHEHFHPQCQADLKLQDTIESFMQPPVNWSEEQARFNMDAAYYFKRLSVQAAPLDSRPVVSDATDRSSVMLYYFAPKYFKSGMASPCRPASASGYATSLSSGDRAFFLAQYSNIPSPM